MYNPWTLPRLCVGVLVGVDIAQQVGTMIRLKVMGYMITGLRRAWYKFFFGYSTLAIVASTLVVLVLGSIPLARVQAKEDPTVSPELTELPATPVVVDPPQELVPTVKSLRARLRSPWFPEWTDASQPPVLTDAKLEELVELFRPDSKTNSIWENAKAALGYDTDERLFRIISICRRKDDGSIRIGANSKQERGIFSICLPEQQRISGEPMPLRLGIAFSLLVHELVHITAYAQPTSAPPHWFEDYRDFEDFALQDLLGNKGEVAAYMAQFGAEIRLERRAGGNANPRGRLLHLFVPFFNDDGDFVGDRTELALVLLNRYQLDSEGVGHYYRTLEAQYLRLPHRR